MKLMIVGAWRWPQYEAAFARGLEAAGITVLRFCTTDFFLGWAGRAQLTLPIPGPSLLRLNRALIREALTHSPSTVLFWRPTHVLPGTIAKLNQIGIRTISYNNDDPFGPKMRPNVPWHHHWLWFWYIKCLPFFDKNFFYRKINCQEAFQQGARHAEVLMSYFDPSQDRPVNLTSQEQQRFASDVVFVGHYEPDGRAEKIRALIKAGIRVKIWSGGDWPRQALGEFYDQLQPIKPALGDDYTKALCGAKICLAFLSKMNRDTYTRRCFEIPACGRLMLAERTDDLKALFEENKEACFFSSNQELVEKTRWLLANHDIRKRIAAAALRRVWADGHDVNSRAKQFLKDIINEH